MHCTNMTTILYTLAHLKHPECALLGVSLPASQVAFAPAQERVCAQTLLQPRPPLPSERLLEAIQCHLGAIQPTPITQN
eukprot:1175565-Prorocentrum_minimum.AAC.1